MRAIADGEWLQSHGRPSEGFETRPMVGEAWLQPHGRLGGVPGMGVEDDSDAAEWLQPSLLAASNIGQTVTAQAEVCQGAGPVAETKRRCSHAAF